VLSPMVWAEEGQIRLAGSCRALRDSGPDAVGWAAVSQRRAEERSQ